MSINCSPRNCSATLTPKRATRRVVLAGRFAHGATLAEQFRKRGWEVVTVAADHDVHAAAAEVVPHAVLVPEAAGDESGYLACAKLRQTRPGLKVVVVAEERTAERERFAEFVGAALAAESDGPAGLVEAAV
jgi:DNA-binding NarL/FixJ family response regulator